MANSKAARQRRRDALAWVISHLPDDEDFTTHDVLAMGDILRNQTWPPYLKSAWRHVAGRRADSVGMAIGRHPDFIHHDAGLADLHHGGVRIRSQRWKRR